MIESSNALPRVTETLQSLDFARICQNLDRERNSLRFVIW
jgi:hypothetical protein